MDAGSRRDPLALPAGMLPAVYAGAATLAAPALRLLLLRRAHRGKEIADRLGERRGRAHAPRPAGRLLWLHAASVGESVSLLPLLVALTAQAPDLNVLLTTGTVTSAALLARRLPEMGLAGRVRHGFAPLDVPRWARRFLDHWHPDAAGFVESEIWPNLLAACTRRRIPVLLLNARLSPRSAAAWARAPRFARRVLGGFAAVAAQSEADAARFRALGAQRVSAPGNLKLAAPDLPADPGELAHWRAAFGTRPVWLAASTHPPEEAIVAHAHQALAPAHPGLLTVLVPRHPERGAAIAAELGGGGIAVTRRAAGQAPPAEGIWIADTLGELGLWYRLAPIALIGRSLVAPGGGQNPLEAARLGCAVAVGPHTGNFREAVARLRTVEALAEVADAAALAAWVGALLDDPARRAAIGARAAAAARGAADLPDALAAALLALLPAAPASAPAGA